MIATALATTVERFLAIGGRLMLDPQGRYSSAINAKLLVERTWPDPEQSEPFAARRRIAGRFIRAENKNRACLARLVGERGEAQPSGWHILKCRT